MNKKTLCKAFAALWLISPAIAYADCHSIADNEEWKVNLNDVAAYHDHGDFSASLSIALKMLSTCDRSPALNYYIALDYQALGDNVKALEYILKASASTTYMATSKDNEQKIRRKRSELEIIVTGESAIDLKESIKEEYRTLMWTGVGIGGAGVLLTLAGSATAWSESQDSSSDSEDKPGPGPENDKDKKSSSSDNTVKNVGYVMLGMGLAMTVGGAVLTGIYGYKYTHLNINENKQLSFQIAPTAVGVSLTF